jgi:hypothetical protein
MSQSQASVGGPERVESGRGLRLPSATRLAGVAAIFAPIQVMYHTVSGVPLDAEFVILAALGGGLSACVVGHLVVNLGVGRRTGFGIIWLALFVVQLFADLIEGAFFTTAISSASVFLGGTIVSLLITAAEAGAAIALFPLPPASRRLRDLLRDYRWGVGSRGLASDGWRPRVLSDLLSLRGVGIALRHPLLHGPFRRPGPRNPIVLGHDTCGAAARVHVCGLHRPDLSGVEAQ